LPSAHRQRPPPPNPGQTLFRGLLPTHRPTGPRHTSPRIKVSSLLDFKTFRRRKRVACSANTGNGKPCRPIRRIPCAGGWTTGTACRSKIGISIGSATSSTSNFRPRSAGSSKTTSSAGTASRPRSATRSGSASTSSNRSKIESYLTHPRKWRRREENLKQSKEEIQLEKRCRCLV